MGSEVTLGSDAVVELLIELGGCGYLIIHRKGGHRYDYPREGGPMDMKALHYTLPYA